MLLLIILALPVGLAFGYAAQRGRFCINSAFRDVYLVRDSTLLRAFVLAVLLQMVGVQLMVEVGLVQVWAVEFFWLANLVGGLVFGVGMVLAGGCSGGSWYKSGEGQLASMAAVVSFAVTAALSEVGFLAPLRMLLQSPTIQTQPDGQGPTLPHLLNLPSPWLVIVPLVVLGGYWLARSPRNRAFRGWTWPKTGLVIGLLGVVAVGASWFTGRPYGFGITFSTSHWLRLLFSFDTSLLDWESFFVIGIPLGAFLAARLAGEFHWRYPGARQMASAVAGGALMGFGAMVMAGCTIGHALAGVPLLAMSSLVSTGAIISGTWATAWLLFGRKVRAAPTTELRSVGEVCPFPLVRAQRALAALQPGEQLRVTFDCMQALESLPRWAEGEGHTLVSRRDLGQGVWQLVIRK
jgi:TusA-related sulfurtransferase